MKIKLVTAGVLVAVLSLLAGVGSAFAAAPAGAAASVGSGPDVAAAPQAGWQSLAVGQRVWYAFNYAGDGSQIDVMMQTDPAGSANFAVWTPGDLQSWQSTGVENPVGRGTVDDSLGGAENWSGDFLDAGTYFVVVDQAGSVPASFNLAVTGSGVSAGPAMPAAPASAMAATTQATAAKPAATTETGKAEATEIANAEGAETAAVAKAETAKSETTTEQAAETAKAESAEATSAATQQPPATAAVAPAGTGPDNALQATGNDVGAALLPGQVRWYAFQAAGDNTQIIVHLSSDPANGATFSVWTPDEVRQLADTGVESPIGRGSANTDYNGDQVWAGNFTSGGTYFIRVEQSGSAPVNNYQLQIMQ